MVSRASHSACRLAPLGTEERTGGRGGCCCLGCLSWVGRRAMGKTRTGPRCGIRYEYDKTFSSTNEILGRATHTPSSQWHSQVSCHGARTTRSAAYVPDVRRRLPGRGRPRDQSVRLGGSVGASCDQSHRSPAQSRPLHPHANPPYFSNSTRWSGCGRSVLRLGLPSIVHGRW